MGQVGHVTRTGNVAQRYKFAGTERDIESGLEMFGARYYLSAREKNRRSE